MRTPVDFNPAVVEPVTPFAERIGRQRQRRSIFAYAHSAPVHRLDMHRPERLHGAIAHIRAHAKASSQPLKRLRGASKASWTPS